VGAGRRFHTIGDALGAAHPGDTVRIGPGVYHEQLRLEPGVTVIGAPAREAILAPLGDGSGPLVAVVAEHIAGARLSGITIQPGSAGPLDVGIRLSGANVTVEDVAVSGARLAGVVVEGDGSPSVIASRIHDNPGAGVLVRAGATARLVHDAIEDNGRRANAPAPGVDVEHGARVALEGNVIVGNGAAGVRGLPRGQHAAVMARNMFEAGARRNPTALAPPASR